MTAFRGGAVALEILTLFCYAQNLVPEAMEPGTLASTRQYD